MQTEKTKDNGTKAGGTDFSFCNPENFQKMFGKMGRYFAGQNNVIDCSGLTDGMMKKMTDLCCPSHTTDLKEKAKHQKDEGKSTESTEKSWGCN
jgi:hypothetical protein